MSYLRVPEQIWLEDIRRKDYSLSPGMYSQVILPTNQTKRVRDLLDPRRPFDKGVEPGSIWYMRRSPRYFIRTKALQEYSNLLYPKGDSIVPINPKAFADPGLQDGDILMAKDSNVGECALVDEGRGGSHMFSGGIVRLHPICDRYYFFSFLKHPLFRAQIRAMTARGATITHAKALWLDCAIPFPTQEDASLVIRYVSSLAKAIVDKEKAIRDKNSAIDREIGNELMEHQKSGRCSYVLPTINEIRSLTRIDVGMYSEDFKRKQFLIENYEFSSGDFEDWGFEVGRGQNLQISCIGKSIYSDQAKPGLYRLVAPTDISEFRTVRQFRYLGNSKSLSLLRQGDVIFGAEGFCKGRSIVLADDIEKTITNIHGVIFHHKDGDIVKGIFLGCFLGYLRAIGLVDAIGAGGSGGSLAIGYFHHVQIPNFPTSKQSEIAKLYHNPSQPPKDVPTLDTFVDWHRRWNVDLGIWELDREMKTLQRTLANVQERIIEGKTVDTTI